MGADERTARHHVGSPYDKDNGGNGCLARFKEWGWDAEIETFSVLFSDADRGASSNCWNPPRFTAKLEESVVSLDPTSNQKSEQLPTYNAYSIDGDVTGPLVYVKLRPARGLRGARSATGISVKGANRHGPPTASPWRRDQAEGRGRKQRRDRLPESTSDPKDDGFAVGEAFPKGPMRPSDGAPARAA